jgi:hypothetical protein
VSTISELCERLERLDTYAVELSTRVGNHPGSCDCQTCRMYQLVNDAAGLTARRLEAAVEQLTLEVVR